jgi:predicted acylesterase/phospholipase RssA
LGCIKKLEEMKLLELKKIVGVSIGAFIGACYIIGYTVDEMLDIIMKKNTKEFRDISLLEVDGAVLKGENYRKLGDRSCFW